MAKIKIVKAITPCPQGHVGAVTIKVVLDTITRDTLIKEDFFCPVCEALAIAESFLEDEEINEALGNR